MELANGLKVAVRYEAATLIPNGYLAASHENHRLRRFFCVLCGFFGKAASGFVQS